MSKTEFNRKTEQEQYKTFMEELKDKVHVVYVTNPKLIPLVTSDKQTGVYIKTKGQTITVFVENGKPNSLKTVAA